MSRASSAAEERRTRAQEHALRGAHPAALSSSALDQSTTSSMDWLARAAVIGASRLVVTECGRHMAAVGLVERLVRLQGTSFGLFVLPLYTSLLLPPQPLWTVALTYSHAMPGQ